ncbi:alpha/beta hydrolase [Sphingobium sp. CAP-1]|uniref:alpha/beta hydrolase n=1 Tax=Sphingobium sp. CAP-1 TaxID=2676077 RepID=UPI0012BB3CAA|nr:alpha/beta hydrolase [Sphingobium sp. CAP-1]QGP81260.1 alpha/beta hydrolase fold domain-containing protein [Sphingobium sp. CAP-1]
MILRILAAAGALLLTAASPDSLLAPVNPELRPMAQVILDAQRSGTPFVPPRPGPLPDGVQERQIAGRNGQPPVTLYVINAGTDRAAPLRGAILFIHGGGFIGGDARENLAALKSLAARLDCVIVSAQYRLATAAPFPAPMEDNYTALKWLHDEAATLGVDRRHIALLGESAGGGLAAMVSLAARDRREVPVAFQALVYPMLDDRTGTSRTVPPHIGQIIWTANQNRKGWSAMLGRKPGGAHAPAGTVPARVADLGGLPPTFIGVGSIDLFADEDIDFARRLVNAGVPTELLVVPGAYHGFQFIAPRAQVSRQFSTALEAALARALASEKK